MFGCISHDKEMRILAVCLRRVRSAHAMVRAMYRRAAAAGRAQDVLASNPRHKPRTPQRKGGRFFDRTPAHMMFVQDQFVSGSS